MKGLDMMGHKWLDKDPYERYSYKHPPLSSSADMKSCFQPQILRVDKVHLLFPSLLTLPPF